MNTILKQSPRLGSPAIAMALFAGAASFAHGALVVYEPFDYTANSAVVGKSGGTGFSTGLGEEDWKGAGTTSNNIVGAGLSFGSLDVAGGSNLRSERSGRGVTSRTISTTSQTSLLAQSTIWFSVLLDPSGGNGFANNTYATLIFGDTAFADANANGAPVLAGGNAFGVGFVGHEPAPSSTDVSLVGIQGVAYNGGTVSTNGEIVPGDVTSFIVGRIDFDDVGNGGSDVLRLYRVTDPNLALPGSPFATIITDLDQSGFDIVSIADPQTSIFDEIRIGTTLASVTVPEPSSLTLLGFGALAMLRRRRK